MIQSMLAAAKARGIALGWSIPSRAGEQRKAAWKGAKANALRADQGAANVLPIIQRIAADGASFRQIAAGLNARGMKTERGGQWSAMQVHNILSRKLASA